jgi:type IV pilus assembly protein PilN
MLIDINLLPEKETKSRGYLYLLLFITLIMAFSVAFLLFNTHANEKKLESIQSLIQTKKQYRLSLEGSLKTYDSSSDSQTLEKAVNWAEEYPIATVPILDHLVALLPERGFFRSFSYTEDGVITLDVQFDTSSEAAYYFTKLQDSKWISDSAISEIKTEDIDTDAQIKTKEEYLPRYIAKYELTVNPLFLKAESKNNEKPNKKGGSHT